MEQISRYLEDKRFTDWVLNPDADLNNWWENYQSANPNEKYNIHLAKKVLGQFKTEDKCLTDEEKILLFSGILKQLEENRSKNKRLAPFVGFMKYAAVAIVFFAIGALLFYQKEHFDPQLYSSQLQEPVVGSDARLIRPNGENIVLNNQKSHIEYRQDGQVVVNDDVIDHGKQESVRPNGLNHLIIPYGKTSEVWLPDGTKVYLNAGSRLIYPETFTDKNREIFLVGEAFFEVTHDEQRPFIVQTSDVRVRVLGTRFNISAYPSDNVIETVLADGKVRLEPNKSGLFGEAYELKPNEMAAFNKKSRETVVKIVDIDNYTLWKDGLFKFESTDLSRIVKKLERYYDIRFNYRSPLAGTIKISGKLSLADDREEIINRIAVAASVNILKKGDNYYEINE